jgi:hypothetical protein
MDVRECAPVTTVPAKRHELFMQKRNLIFDG